MARYINILLFTLFSFVAQSEASSWEERLDGAAAKAYDSGCEKYPDIDALDKKLRRVPQGQVLPRAPKTLSFNLRFSPLQKC